ncbi:MAG: DUF1554 domain-containing protein [Leptospiraceae bacterium]|nr:DUF1554 domain-containing protein [Leptospiraceae bacterium]
MKKYLLTPILLVLIFIQQCSNLNKDLDRDFLANLGLFWKRSNQVELSGTAVKGIVTGATVRVLPLVNNACDRSGSTSSLAETVTDENGAYSLRYTKDGKPVCVLVTPASNGLTKMYDETQKQFLGWTNSTYYLDSIIAQPGGLTKKGVLSSPFSRMSARVFAKTMQKSDASFANAVAGSSSRQIVAMFGLNKGFIKSGSKTLNTSSKKKSYLKTFGKVNIPQKPGRNGQANLTKEFTRNSSQEVIPPLEDLNLNLTNAEDPFTAKYMLVSSGISALANKLATANSKSLSKEKFQRDSANGDAIEQVINGFAEVVESGGKKSTILSSMMQKIGVKYSPTKFNKDPLETTMQTGIASYVTESGGGEEWGISADEISTYFEMSSVPPSNLMIDTASPPDYLYYGGKTEDEAMIFATGGFDFYYPWVEGGLPTQYEEIGSVLSTLGLILNPLDGTISGSPTTATANLVTVKVRASNIYGSTETEFSIKVINPGALNMGYFAYCAVNDSCFVYPYLEQNWEEVPITSLSATTLNGFTIENDPDFGYYFTHSDPTSLSEGNLTISGITINGSSNYSITIYVYADPFGSDTIAIPTGLINYGTSLLDCDAYTSICSDEFGQAISSYPYLNLTTPLTNATFSLANSPPNFSIDPSTGQIYTYMDCTENSYYAMTVSVISDEGSETFNLPVMINTASCGGGGFAPTISADVTSCTVGTSCSITISSNVSSPSYSESIPATTLSAFGLSLDSATGIISGTPTQYGSLNYFIDVSGVEGTFSGYGFVLSISPSATNYYFWPHSLGGTGANLGGIAGADSICASSPNKPAGVTVAKAFLVLPGVRVACTTSNCSIGGVAEQIDWPLIPNKMYYDRSTSYPIGSTDANGLLTFPLTGGISGNWPYWTGLNSDWTANSANCSNWASSSSGTTGQRGGVITTYTDTRFITESILPCNDSGTNLLCTGF